MNISIENLSRVKRSFEAAVEKNNIMDSEYPFFNTYMWKGDILFSGGYRTQFLAREKADQSFFEPKIANAKENDIAWMGVFDGSRTMISARKY